MKNKKNVNNSVKENKNNNEIVKQNSVKENKSKKTIKEPQTKEEKILNLLDWLKFIALVSIFLPICLMIFRGFNYVYLAFIIFGVLLFMFNMFFGYNIEQKMIKRQDLYEKNKMNKNDKNNKIN